MKNFKKLGIFAGVLCLCFGAVACGKPFRENPHVPAEISPTVAPTATPIPATTTVPVQGVAISEENFGDARFCNYLKEKFDKNGNGYFSDAELREVKEIRMGMKTLLTPYSEMKGFSYFTELERLELNSADKVEICDVPKLSEIEIYRRTSVQKYQLGDMTIRNCPELETVSVRDMTVIVGQGKDVAEFAVENCPKLRMMSVSGEGMNPLEKMTLRVFGTPKLSLYTSVDRPGKMVLDTSVFQSLELPVVDIKNKKVDTSGLNYIIWNGETVTEYEAALTELEEVIVKLQEGFFVEVQEVSPALYDEEGRKAYQVFLNNKYLTGDYYGINDVRLGYYGDYENDTFVMYSDEPLTAEHFYFQWQELLTMPVKDYSPLRGFHGQFCGTIPGDNDDTRHGFAGDLFYRNGENKVYFGEVTVRISYSVTPENGLRFWTKTEYDENMEERYVQEGIWFAEASEFVTPGADELPITQEYFSNLVFRDYLEENVDLDRNGYLSLAEREALTVLYAEDYDMGPNEVDGLHYFPNLRKICIGECKKLVCKNCPELRLIAIFGSDPYDAVIRVGTAEVVTENCPKLELIDTSMHPDVYWDNYLDW